MQNSLFSLQISSRMHRHRHTSYFDARSSAASPPWPSESLSAPSSSSSPTILEVEDQEKANMKKEGGAWQKRTSRPKQMETSHRQVETRLKGRDEEKHAGGLAFSFFSPGKLLNRKHGPKKHQWISSSSDVLFSEGNAVLKRRKHEPPPVVRRVGFVYLHQAVIFVGWMVRSQDVHLIPFLRFLPVKHNSENEWQSISSHTSTHCTDKKILSLTPRAVHHFTWAFGLMHI